MLSLGKRFLKLLLLVTLFLSLIQFLQNIDKLSNPEYAAGAHFLELLPVNLAFAALTVLVLLFYFRNGKLVIPNADDSLKQYTQNHLSYMGFSVEENGVNKYRLNSQYFFMNMAAGYGHISEREGNLEVTAPRIYLKKLSKRISNSSNLNIKEAFWT